MARGRRGGAAAAAAVLGLPLSGLLGGCVTVTEYDEPGTDGGGECTSRYRETTRAPTRARLVARVQATIERNPAGQRDRPIEQPVVAETAGSYEQGGARVQGVGFYTDGGDGGRIGLVDVVRLDDGTWFAGVWGQCIHGGDSRYPAGWPSD